MNVLLVDANAARGMLLLRQLEEQHFDVRTVASADAALKAVAEQSFRALVIEHDLPGTAGRLTQRLRADGCGTPIIVLTDDTVPATKVALLDDGVDDVLVRPFPPELLPAQIRSLLRRCAPSEGAVLKFEDLTLDLRSLQLSRQGRLIPSTSRELAVLEYFLRNRQRVISRNELSEAVWKDTALPESNVIEVFIARLRRKVDRPFGVPLIHTIVGRGYMLSVTKPGTGEATD
ncbi:MAG TPA: response regulator transcription factor [Tepidisphaeraceae bacterium]|jgi:DNA-binding response OmpR family regulator